MDKEGNIIHAPRRGRPEVTDPTHHIYVNKNEIPKAFTGAGARKGAGVPEQPKGPD